MRNHRYTCAAGAMALAVLLTGCGNAEKISSQPQTSDTAEVQTAQQSAEQTSKPADSSEEEPTAESSTVPSAEEKPETTEAPAQTTAPDVTGGYMADWIYGTWSVISVNGQEFWSYADENGLDGEQQLVFDSAECRRVSGSAGVDTVYTYKITDEGAVLYEENMDVWADFVYDPANDTITYSENGVAIVLKRGENPRQSISSGADGGYIADWIYGTWSVISVDGEDYWEWADENGESGEYQLIFTAEDCRALGGGSDGSKSMRYSITDSGAVVEFQGQEVEIIYDYINDTLRMNDGSLFVLKRGEYPRS